VRKGVTGVVSGLQDLVSREAGMWGARARGTAKKCVLGTAGREQVKFRWQATVMERKDPYGK